MKFFINSSFNKQNSGIEHAQLKRAKLFRDHGEAFKLVFREWNPRLHMYLSEVGVSPEETLCMFDFFQNAENVEERVLTVEDLDFGVQGISRIEQVDQKLYMVQVGNQLIARVRYFLDDDKKRVSMVELFDAFGNLYRVDNYDFRGFLSLVQWYTPDNKIGTEVWYDIEGRTVLETFNKFDGTGKFVKTGWRLTFGEQVYMFDNIDKLTQHFFNLINAKYWSDDELNIFILDRTHLGDWSVLELERPAYTVMHLHNSHAGDAQDTMHSVMNNFYEYGLTNMNRYDAVISATQKQTNDVIARFNPKCKMFTIAVGVTPDAVFEEAHIPMSERKHHSVLVTARVAPEKRIDMIIRAIGEARKTVPDITLDFYGYVDHRDNDAAMNAINAAIKEYDMADAVHQFDYSEDVPSLHKQHQVYGLFSIMEGFNLSLMEAQARGMVSVSTDVNYGPNELTVDGENGYVVGYDDIDGFADRLVKLFSDDELLQQMSDKAYELSERYSEANVWKAWQALLDDAKAKPFSYASDVTEGIGNQEIHH
ncbi:MAG: glycosyltransferase [Streptococcaceae bacterium]|jgi:poly(glycerol-phosphate) alpha-glucosyltransferase|nr:glycosyltransferase [Streptococcaceae bacterium]